MILVSIKLGAASLAQSMVFRSATIGYFSGSLRLSLKIILLPLAATTVSTLVNMRTAPVSTDATFNVEPSGVTSVKYSTYLPSLVKVERDRLATGCATSSLGVGLKPR